MVSPTRAKALAKLLASIASEIDPSLSGRYAKQRRSRQHQNEGSPRLAGPVQVWTMATEAPELPGSALRQQE